MTQKVIARNMDISKFDCMIYKQEKITFSEEMNIITAFIEKVKSQIKNDSYSSLEIIRKAKKTLYPSESLRPKRIVETTENSTKYSIRPNKRRLIFKTSDLVMPKRRPTAIPMISRNRKLSSRITQRLSPYILSRMQESGSFNRLENDVVELPYNENMARIRPQRVKSDKERAQRDRNNVASRQSRLKAKILEREMQSIASTVKEENKGQKMKIAMHKIYIQKLGRRLNVHLDLDASWAKEMKKGGNVTESEDETSEDDNDY